MSFLDGKNDFAIPPADVPIPELERANLRGVGTELAQGQRDAGWFDSIWESLSRWAVDIVSAILAFILKMLVPIAIFWAKTWTVAGRSMDPAIQDAAAIAVGDAFGVTVTGSSFETISGTGGRTEVAKNVAEAILISMGGNFDTATGQTLSPSSERAEAWLQSVVSLSIEGWLESWFFEMITLGQCEYAGKLKDALVSSIGMGRISSRVLRPVLDATVIGPFDWKVNKSYRPKLLSVSESVRQFVRGRWTRAQLDEELSRQGYSSERIDSLIASNVQRLGVSVLWTLVQDKTMTLEQAQEYLQESGYDAQTAARALTAQSADDIHSLNRQLANVWSDAFVNNQCSQQEFTDVLQSIGLPDSELAALTSIAVSKKQFNTKTISPSTMETMVKAGLKTFDDYRNTLLDYGYSVSDARDLELLLMTQMKSISDAKKALAEKQKAAAEAAAAREATAAAKKAAEQLRLLNKGVSLAKEEAMVRAGIRTLAQYRTFLTNNGTPANNADDLVALLSESIEAARQVALQRAQLQAAGEQKGVSLSQLDKAVRAGVLSVDEYQQQLRALDYDENTVALLVELATNDIQDAKTRQQTRDAAAAASADKGVSLSQFERAVRLGIRSLDDYSSFLTSQGYGDDDVALLTDTLSKQLDADTAAQQLRADAAAKSSARGLSLAQLETAVRAGVKTMADYRAALLDLGYDADAQDTLISLLQLKLDQDQQTFALQGKASALLGQRGLSLNDIARGVELGIVKPEVYTDTLKAAGLNQDDADYLTLIEASRVAQRQQQLQQTQAAAPVLARAGLSLASLQSDVRAGRLTLDQFAQQLAAAGVDAAQVQTLTSLLSTEVDAIAAANILRQQADQLPPIKNLTLSQMEKAVREGLAGVADYQDFAVQLGYDDADAALLAGTLAATLPQGEQQA